MNENIRNFGLFLSATAFASNWFDLDPWECELLQSNEPRLMLNCSRQSGKSTITALLALHHALDNPGSLTLILSPSSRQSGELFKKIMAFYKDLGKPIASEIEQAMTLQLYNNSRIVSLPGKEQTVRGFSGVSLMIIDEAAQVPDDLYYSVRPMLAVSGGRLILLSTPYGKRGFFWHEWDESDAWKKIKIPADQCPRIAKEFLAEEKASLGSYWYNQEYMCEFEANASAYFDPDDIAAAMDSDVKALTLDADGKLDFASFFGVRSPEELPTHPRKRTRRF
jgi:hypothetical protein